MTAERKMFLSYDNLKGSNRKDLPFITFHGNKTCNLISLDITESNLLKKFPLVAGPRINYYVTGNVKPEGQDEEQIGFMYIEDREEKIVNGIFSGIFVFTFKPEKVLGNLRLLFRNDHIDKPNGKVLQIKMKTDKCIESWNLKCSVQVLHHSAEEEYLYPGFWKDVDEINRLYDENIAIAPEECFDDLKIVKMLSFYAHWGRIYLCNNKLLESSNAEDCSRTVTFDYRLDLRNVQYCLLKTIVKGQSTNTSYHFTKESFSFLNRNMLCFDDHTPFAPYTDDKINWKLPIKTSDRKLDYFTLSVEFTPFYPSEKLLYVIKNCPTWKQEFELKNIDLKYRPGGVGYEETRKHYYGMAEGFNKIDTSK